MNDGKKIKYNLIVGIASQVIALVLGIVIPKLILTNYGSEINGLLSSITNIYSYIAIVEAGVAAATCQALYKPIVEKKRNDINAILSATNKYYHKTGLIYLGLILLFSLLFPAFITTNIPYFTVLLLILFNGLGNVVNYFFHGKYLILLKADGKNFVRTGFETVANVFKQVSKIILISLGFNVIFVQLVAMLVSFVQMIYITLYIKKHYSWLDLSVKPNNASISQSKNVLIHEINYLITANIDTVVLTFFTNLKIVSVYSMYNLLFGMINRILLSVRDALEFKIAHIFHKNREEFLKLFRTFEALYISFTFAVFSVAYYFVIPFLKLYTKGVTDIDYINRNLPLLFVMVNLFSTIRYPLEAMIHISGHFKKTQNSAILESAINLVSTLVLVNIWGIEGALIGTIISSIYRALYLNIYVNKKIIVTGIKDTSFCWIINFVLFALTCVISKYVVINLNSYKDIFIYCVPYAICVCVLHFAVISLCVPKVFKHILFILRKLINKKIS